MGFRQGRRSPEAEKKSSPHPSSPFQKTSRLAKQRFPPVSTLQVITPPPLPYRLGRFFAFPIPCLVSDITCTLFVYLYSYVILSGGAVHVSSLPYLILHLPTRNLRLFYCTVPILDRNHSSKQYVWSVFTYVASIYANLLEQKKAFA